MSDQAAANLISQLTAAENALTEALENEDYAQAEALNDERTALIQELVQIFHQSEDAQQKQELQNFARALQAHGQETLQALQEERDKAREELIKLRRSQSGRSVYQQVRKTRG